MQPFRQVAISASGWIKRNVALVVALNVCLSLGIFGVLEYQQTQINDNAVKIDCWVAVLDHIVSHKPPDITHQDIAAAQVCEKIP